MKATLTTISSSPVKEKSFLIVDHFFLFVNQTWMWKGGPPAHPCWITTFKRCKHIHHSSTVACHHTSLTPAFQHWFSPYLLFPSVSGCTGAKCEGITGGKRRHRDLDLGQRIKMPGIFQAQSYQSSVTEMMSAQCCCLGRDATCPSAHKRLWGSRNETFSALCQAPALPPSSYSPSATHPDSKAMEIDTWWPKHVHTLPRWPQMAREMAALWQTVPGGGDEVKLRSKLTSTSVVCGLVTALVTPGQGLPLSVLRSGWAERWGDTWVWHRARDGFLGGNLKSRMEGKCLGAGGRRCASTRSRFARHRGLCSHCDIQPHSKCVLIIQ